MFPEFAFSLSTRVVGEPIRMQPVVGGHSLAQSDVGMVDADHCAPGQGPAALKMSSKTGDGEVALVQFPLGNWDSSVSQAYIFCFESQP